MFIFKEEKAVSRKLFPIGFWSTLDAVKFGVEGVKDWKDFGATVGFTGFYNYNPDKEKMLEIFDECEKQGIEMFLVDQRTDAKNLNNDKYFYDILEKNVSDFANHPAVRGFFICDEPNEHTKENAVEVISKYNELCPEKETIVNLLPWMPPDRNVHSLLLSENDDDYSQRIIDFIKKSKTTYLMFDCYVQFQDRVPNEFWLNAYFKNLNLFKNCADEANVDLWFNGLATGHGGYRCPNQDEFRWQLSTAVAHGVQGFFYWFMYSEKYNINYRCHPINQFNERTDSFRWISTENRIFQMVYGALFNELKLEKVYHVHKSYAGTELLNEENDEFIKEVRSYDEHDNFVPAIISRFKRPDDDRTYYALVNNSTEASTATYVKFKKKVEYYWIENYWEEIGVHRLSECEPDSEKHFWCAPGQLWVFAVK